MKDIKITFNVLLYLADFDDEVGCPGFDQLPFGACEDPVR